MQQKGKKRVTIRVAVGAMFVIVTSLTALIAVSLQYYFARESELDHALNKYRQIAGTVTEQLAQLDFIAMHTTRQAAQIIKVLGDVEPGKPLLESFAQALQTNDGLYSIYVAGDDDSFFQLISLASPAIREKVHAHGSDRWLLIVHQGAQGERTKDSFYYDADFSLRTRQTEASTYYPSQRNWFIKAGVDRIHKTAPYLFHNLKVTGQSYAMRLNSEFVLGVDVTLAAIESRLASSVVSDSVDADTEAFLFLEDGRLIATNQEVDISDDLPLVEPMALSADEWALVNSTPPLRVSNQDDYEPMDFSISGTPYGYTMDVFKIVADMTGLKFDYANGRSWNELTEDYQAGKLDILHAIAQQSERRFPGIYGEPLYQVSYGVLSMSGSQLASDLAGLEGRKVGILKGWSIIDTLKAHHPDIKLVIYDSIHQAMVDVQAGKIYGLLDLTPVLAHKAKQKFYTGLKVTELDEDLLPGNFLYAMGEQHQELVEIINRALQAITPAQRAALHDKWLRPTERFTHYTHVPYELILDYAAAENAGKQMHKVEINGLTQYLYVSALSRGQGEFLAVLVPSSVIMATVNQRIIYFIAFSLLILGMLLPLSWLFGNPISTPINALRRQTHKIEERRYADVKVIDSHIKEVFELSRDIRSMADSIAAHQQAQDEFIETIIRIIANAIDEKSPYTAGHCNRVPELGMMLAKAAERDNTEAFRAFEFNSEDERREFRIAAWLHDCGKITTPEYIVDKGSKLETNYNRIHEVRTRFEVLWRDAEIAALKQQLQGQDEQSVAAELAQKQQALQQEFAFIARANVGSEFMSDDDIARVKTIGAQQWVRHFDNRLGLGPLEEERYPQTQVPAMEPLLADKPEHVIERERPMELDPVLGINMNIPEHQYNHGELYNLCIKRGTLTAEDRFKINEHMISGIKMLEEIPFPPELARVPRYASTHHETLRGDGYPRKLNGAQLSVPERILVLADIFEALTASDRPYKKAKPLSVAVDILHKMALDKHLDIEVFNLFLSSGVYLDYARAFLPEAQIDTVDIGKYLDNNTEVELPRAG
ncbi:transporter substrate-binding domain-containing protein [Shewanella corallii]|uniref:Transporter substrate-binding domain-containing protein n=1 Tax=Shewanella corallii TaxID=560080 RepID=A0ABT0NAI0_9GAMM|nr:transporter substrate-binding domain-containing protein [Shewanella corallii]